MTERAPGDAAYRDLLTRVRRFVPWGIAAADRDDVAQDAVVKLLLAGADGGADDRLVRAKTKDAAKAFARRFYNTGRPVTVVPAADVDALADARLVADDPAELVLAGDPVLSQAVASLPPRQRAVMRLVAAGYTTGEIAERAGCSVDAVRAARSRAGRSLRGLLGPALPPVVVAVVVLLMVALAATLRHPEPTSPPPLQWPFGSSGLGFSGQPSVRPCAQRSQAPSVAPPDVDAVLRDIGPGLGGLTATVEMRADTQASGVTVLGVDVAVLTQDGNVVGGDTLLGRDHPEPPDRTHGVSATRSHHGLNVLPCLDPRTGRPARLGDRYLVLATVAWHDAFGTRREWRLPVKRLTFEWPERRLPVLRATGCVTSGDHVYAGLVAIGPQPIDLSIVTRNVTARKGVARLEVVLSNATGAPMRLGHDGHRIGVGAAGRTFTLGDGRAAVLPVELQMARCQDGRPASAVGSGAYIVSLQSLHRAVGDGRSSPWGALVVVP